MPSIATTISSPGICTLSLFKEDLDIKSSGYREFSAWAASVASPAAIGSAFILQVMKHQSASIFGVSIEVIAVSS